MSYGYCQREYLDPYRDELKHDMNHPHHPDWVAHSPMAEDFYDAGIIVQMLYNEFNSTYNKESTKNNSTLFGTWYTIPVISIRFTLFLPFFS